MERVQALEPDRTWVQIPPTQVTSCVTLGMSLNFSDLHFLISILEMIIVLQMVGEDLKYYIQSIGTFYW